MAATALTVSSLATMAASRRLVLLFLTMRPSWLVDRVRRRGEARARALFSAVATLLAALWATLLMEEERRGVPVLRVGR